MLCVGFEYDFDRTPILTHCTFKPETGFLFVFFLWCLLIASCSDSVLSSGFAGKG